MPSNLQSLFRTDQYEFLYAGNGKRGRCSQPPVPGFHAPVAWGSINQPTERIHVEDAMSRHVLLTFAALLLAQAPTALAQNLTEAQARAIIAPWYSLFNVATRGDVKSIQEQVLTIDYESCSGYLPGECWGRDTSIKVVGNFAKSIPDMKFDIEEVLVAGDRVIVRGEVTGTPAGELFGVAHTGNSFRMMAIDIQTIKDGKIAKTYHMENWLSALGQLRAK
jgi:ketosteroid isomerase-like protein